jgi:hypothetical protein
MKPLSNQGEFLKTVSSAFFCRTLIHGPLVRTLPHALVPFFPSAMDWLKFRQLFIGKGRTFRIIDRGALCGGMDFRPLFRS